jgi:hypothetical protein
LDLESRGKEWGEEEQFKEESGSYTYGKGRLTYLAARQALGQSKVPLAGGGARQDGVR